MIFLNRVKPNHTFIPFLLFALFFGVISPANAQVLNIEKYRTDTDSANVWSGSLSFGLDLTRQKNEVLQIRNESNLAYYSKNNVYMMINNFNLVKIGDELANDGYFHIRATFNRQSRWSPEAFSQYQYSENWGLRRRVLLGGGVLYDFIRSDHFSAGVMTGAMYEHEVWKASDSPRRQYDRLKSTTSILMRGRPAENIGLVLTGYYQAEPETFLEPRLTGDIQVQFNISRLVTFSVQFSTTYDHRPAPGVTDLIYSLKNNVIISF